MSTPASDTAAIPATVAADTGAGPAIEPGVQQAMRRALTLAARGRATGQNPQESVSDDGSVSADQAGGPPGTRTPNLWIKSPQLCH